jgi:two-component system, sporulation sensor kinase E
VAAEQEDGKVVVHFMDDGVGIPEDKLEEIGTPFYTTKEDARTRDPNAVIGTGLGLYMCRQIMEHHQGEIRIKSKPGEGTKFTLIFNRLR